MERAPRRASQSPTPPPLSPGALERSRDGDDSHEDDPGMDERCTFHNPLDPGKGIPASGTVTNDRLENEAINRTSEIASPRRSPDTVLGVFPMLAPIVPRASRITLQIPLGLNPTPRPLSPGARSELERKLVRELMNIFSWFYRIGENVPPGIRGVMRALDAHGFQGRIGQAHIRDVERILNGNLRGADERVVEEVRNGLHQIAEGRNRTRGRKRADTESRGGLSKDFSSSGSIVDD